ncbi:hypothetical protein AB0B01_13920 [Streptomyces sp. NPDC044571]|uniref:hypothetical protein n=1 Tax=Streptomyces sp. NPDC044571 TaxID=3155371 RepID=UPI0033E9BED5
MPIDPYTALNAMLRAEAARCTPPAARQPDPEEAAAAADTAAAARGEDRAGE